jgi:hypothetical protein
MVEVRGYGFIFDDARGLTIIEPELMGEADTRRMSIGDFRRE